MEGTNIGVTEDGAIVNEEENTTASRLINQEKNERYDNGAEQGKSRRSKPRDNNKRGKIGSNDQSKKKRKNL